MSNLMEKHNYLNKSILNLKSSVIREYDMKDAGFTIIRNNNLLDQKTITHLESLSKHAKNVSVGCILRDNKDLSKFIIEEFVKIRTKFMELNGFSEDDVLSIKKDAIITINKAAKVTEFDGYLFRNKNKYSSYFLLNDKEFYYSSWDDRLDTKGFGVEAVKLHSDYFLNDIKSLIRYNERLQPDNMIKVLQKYRNDYLNLELDLNCYRELNFDSKFRLKLSLADTPVCTDNMSKELLDKLDITYNFMHYIIPLIGLII